MSRCAHAQSTYKLMKMPHCRKCKAELMYVMVKYDNDKDCCWEWECVKCGKIYLPNKIKTPEPYPQDKELTERLQSWNKDTKRLYNPSVK